MDDAEIIAARRAYEAEVWRVFGETVLCMPDMTEARLAFNDRAGRLREALPSEVRRTLRPWQEALNVSSST